MCLCVYISCVYSKMYMYMFKMIKNKEPILGLSVFSGLRFLLVLFVTFTRPGTDETV